jgi:hypothetical protein
VPAYREAPQKPGAARSVGFAGLLTREPAAIQAIEEAFRPLSADA